MSGIEKIKHALSCLVLAALFILTIRVYFFVDSVGDTTRRVDTFITEDRLKNLENNLNTSAISAQMTANAYSEIAKSTTDVLSKKVGPMIDQSSRDLHRVMMSVDGRLQDLHRIDGLLLSLTDTSKGITQFLANTDQSINQELLPESANLVASLNEVAQGFGITTSELNTAIKMASEQANKSLDAVYTIVSDPKIQSMLTNVEATSASVASTMASVDAAAKQAPSIAASLEKIAATSSRYTKITLIANILATIARAFIP